MPWLRIDDGFAFHPKVGTLTRGERWTWMEVMCHCATQKTGGSIPDNIAELYRYVTPAFLEKAEQAGLIDRDEDGRLHVHDWSVYNQAQETAAERQKRYRERHARRNGNVTDDVADHVTRDVTDDVATRARVRPRPQPHPLNTETAPVPVTATKTSGAGSGTGDLQRLNPETILAAATQDDDLPL